MGKSGRPWSVPGLAAFALSDAPRIPPAAPPAISSAAAPSPADRSAAHLRRVAHDTSQLGAVALTAAVTTSSPSLSAAWDPPVNFHDGSPAPPP
jgi:hypothetical protein